MCACVYWIFKQNEWLISIIINNITKFIQLIQICFKYSFFCAFTFTITITITWSSQSINQQKLIIIIINNNKYNAQV